MKLEPQSSLERELAEGQRHKYVVELRRNEYFRLVVEQLGVDVAVELSAPDGQRLYRLDTPTPHYGTAGKETLEWVASAPGQHRIEVRAQTGSSPDNSYRIQVVARRPATLRDRDRATATRAFAEGHGLRLERSFDHALAKYQTAARHWGSADEPWSEARALRWIGKMYKELGEPREAVAWTRRALELFRRSGDAGEQIASTLNHLGRLYRDLDDELNALACQREALEWARRLQNRRSEASYLNNLAVTHRKFGRAREALHLYTQALEICRGICEPAELAKKQANLGGLYSLLGRFDRARLLLEGALEVQRESEDPHAEARVLTHLAVVQRRQGSPEEALASLERALEVRHAGPDSKELALSLKELGNTHLASGSTEAAKKAFEEALEIYRRLGVRGGEAQVRTHLGWLFTEIGDAERALASLEPALRFFRETGSRGGEASALHAAARAERLRGDLDAARSRIERAIEIVESLRTQIEIAKLRSSYLARKQDYYGLHIDILVDLHLRDPAAGFDALAFTVSEQRRARSLLDDLIDARGESDRRPDPDLLDRRRELQRAIDAKDLELQKLLREEPSSAGGARAERELEQLRISKEGLEIRLEADIPATDRPPPRLAVWEARELLDPETLLLQITLGETRSFLWLLTPTALELHLLAGRDQIEKTARRAYDLLTRSRDRATRGRLDIVSRELSRLLLEPVATRLGNKRLLLISDAALQYVPFAALPLPHGHPAATGIGPGPAPMVSVYEIVQVPSLSVLSILRRRASALPPPSKTLAVVADPVFELDDPRLDSAPAASAEPGESLLPPLQRLPGSAEEAAAILALVPEDDRRLALLGLDANHEKVLTGILNDYRYVHFATHSLFDPQRPEASGIALSRFDPRGQPTRLSILRNHEILAMKLPAEMVALSACQSGLGHEVRGEGLVGLTQSFLYAGASRVLVSFWPVDDLGTAELMARFYRGILERGLRPAAALREAQLSMLDQQRWRAPYYWAGFFLQGEWR